MRVVLQRVSQAAVRVDAEVVGEVSRGWLALVGVHSSDTARDACWLAEKIAGLRAFPDEQGKMNRSVQDVKGGILVVSNFTLYGDCLKGRRPSFVAAARPEQAEPLIERLIEELRALGLPVASGRFGADMQIALVNDGPVTLIIETVAKDDRADSHG
jgi:D-tyrosyl-tRNA(Tyr) deacylase